MRCSTQQPAFNYQMNEIWIDLWALCWQIPLYHYCDSSKFSILVWFDIKILIWCQYFEFLIYWLITTTKDFSHIRHLTSLSITICATGSAVSLAMGVLFGTLSAVGAYQISQDRKNVWLLLGECLVALWMATFFSFNPQLFVYYLQAAHKFQAIKYLAVWCVFKVVIIIHVSAYIRPS